MSRRKPPRNGEGQSLPVARLAHACPSRTRLQFPGFKGQPDALTNLCEAVAALAGVRQVEARPATGSVIITHEGTSAGLNEAARVAGLFLVEDVAQAHAPSFEAAGWKERIDGFIKDTIGGGYDLPTIAALVFIAMALRQLAAGRIMPPAATALWYGLSLLLMKGASPDIAADPGDLGE